MSNSSFSVSQNFSQIMFANQSQTFSGIKTFDEALINNAMPALTGTQDVNQWLKSLRQLHIKNTNTYTRAVQYAHGATAVDYAYSSGVYSPTQNRIYFAPSSQASQTNWHYIDCNTGSVVAYAHGVTALLYAYAGGVYSPTQNRIYFIPNRQGNQTNWHYIQFAGDNSGIIPYMFGSTILSSTL